MLVRLLVRLLDRLRGWSDRLSIVSSGAPSSDTDVGRNRSDPSITPSFRRLELGILLLGVGVRLSLVVIGEGTRRFTLNDTTGYVAVARDLPSVVWSPSPQLLEMSVRRTPGYPIFLRLVSLFDSRINLTWVAVVQCLVGGALVVYLTIVLGRRLFSAGVGLIAGFLVAIDPASIGHSVLVLTETLFTVALLCVLISLERILRTRGMNWAFALGGAFSFSLLVRPSFYYLTPVVPLVIWAVVRSRRGLLLSSIVALSVLIPVSAWNVRNHNLIHSFRFSTIEGQSAFYWKAAGAIAEDGGISWREAVEVLEEKYARDLSIDDIGRLDAALRRDGIHEIVEHPRGYVLSAARSVKRTVLGPGHSYILDQLPSSLRGPLRPVIVGFSVLNLLVVDLAALLGLWFAAGRRNWLAIGVLVAPVVAYLGIAAGPEMDVRFRVPVAPLVAILGGFGLLTIQKWAYSRSGDVERAERS